MKNLLIAVAIAAFTAVTFNAYAHDSDRIDQLEKELQETKLRVSKLESLLSNPSNAQQHVTSAEGWKSVMNWRKLTKGMTPSNVPKILGEPQRLDGVRFPLFFVFQGSEHQATHVRSC